jgi:hypothetical protein
MTDETKREGDWTGDEWAGDETARQGDPVANDTEQTAAGSDRWNKTEWVGDQGHGAPAPVDPDEMAEGETSISGNRHASGEQHWAGGTSSEHEPATGDRPLERETDA